MMFDTLTFLLQDLTALSERQVITSPRYPDSPPPPGKQCEYRIMVSDCISDSLLFNKWDIIHGIP